MMGRSHMAIGAVGAVAATPLVLHERWESLRDLLTHPWASMPHIVVVQAAFVAATVVGALVPDLDQQDAKLTYTIEIVFGLPVLALAIVVMVLMHWATSLTAWGIALLLMFIFGAAHNVTRMLGLGALATILLDLAYHHRMPMEAAVLLAAWMVATMPAKHRTFTHSLLGLAVFGAGCYLSEPALSHLHLGVAAYGLILGYVLHMAADFIAGGVPLLWPWGKRQGVHLVKSFSAVDYLIGGIGIFTFVGLALV
ncbi:metal-dependent hydrolase [Alicyclobacillus vulcanalis]|uniref:Membrane-bound metal-dependent hydrolase n=3 Tax=Alicyclobacillus TaxID=29330 RepID=C8WYC7_ALIAD|nr:metal-dependent hydrolase [Alicyclobacillus vulcanalis]ACV60021.1 membrane-bound metal-dependent hydrolase [Alicyclobacillus acidocaldarius subsp. acidocaldarius DSM 446]SIT11342.1 inner membrane protein [Alicyclobacillus vulcanalis]